MYCKIKDIGLNRPNTPVKAFVSKKYGPKVSAKGNLYLKLILEDDSGKIQAMIYDDVQKQNKIFQLNKGYIIRDVTVEKTKQEFETYGHDYELIITSSTKVKQYDMPTTPPNSFTHLRDLPSHVLDENINIIGQVEKIGELQAHDTRIKTKTPHREVTIKDQTGREMVSLWGDKAKEDIKPGDVITISPVKLGLYKGSLKVGTVWERVKSSWSLSSLFSKVVSEGGLSVQSRYNSSMMINPMIPEADKLRDLNNLSDSDSELTVIHTPKRKKRKTISCSCESSESELKLKQSKNWQLDNYSNLSARQTQQKPKKEKTSTVIAEDSSDEEIADDHGRDNQTQKILESNSNGSDDDENTRIKVNAKRCTKRKVEEEQHSDSSSVHSVVRKKKKKRVVLQESDSSSSGQSDEDVVSTDDETPASDKSNDDDRNTKCGATVSSGEASSDDDSSTDDGSNDKSNDYTDDGDDTDELTEEDDQLDNYNQQLSTINEHMKDKVVSFVYWTVFGDRDKLTTQHALSLQKEIESKMEACISQAWSKDIQKALEKCPVFRPIETDRSEIETLKDCEVCHRKSHPWKYRVILSGIPYNKRTMEEGEDKDEEKFEFLMGNYCYNRAKLYHKLYHYKYELNHECKRKIAKLGNNRDKLFKNKAFLNKQYRNITKMFKDVEMEICEDGDSARRGTRFQRDFFGKQGAFQFTEW